MLIVYERALGLAVARALWRRKYVYSDAFIVYEVTLYKNIKYNVEKNY